MKPLSTKPRRLCLLPSGRLHINPGLLHVSYPVEGCMHVNLGLLHCVNLHAPLQTLICCSLGDIPLWLLLGSVR